MPTYVALYNWTEQGIKNVKESRKRYDAGVKAAEKAGIRVLQFVYTMGAYDIVGIFEAKDEETFNAFSLSLASKGNVRSTTMRAYSVDEMSKILSKL